MRPRDLAELIQNSPEIAHDYLVENGCEAVAERINFHPASRDYWAVFFKVGKRHPDYQSQEEHNEWVVAGKGTSESGKMSDLWYQAARLVDSLSDETNHDVR